MAVTLHRINERLQNAPQDILDDVLGFVECLLANNITEEAQAEMRAIAARPVLEHIPEEQVEEELAKKYGF